ncbi:MAG: SDR family NAD(P)-dependent oxidoreductase, partial [Anaerolineae bacterium]
HETPADYWELLIQINLLAPMRLTHLLLPDKIARGGGHIVNMSSVSGWIGTLGMVPYSTSKYGLRGFGEALSEDMAQHNIRVTNVYPFYSRTPMIGAPRHGSLPEPNLSDDLVTDPAEVIRQAVAGIEADVLHLFPDRYARTLSLIKRYIPRILPRLFKRLES